MDRFQRVFLSVVSGILLSLPWLGLPGWILFVAFVPLLYLDQFFVKRKNSYQSVSFWSHAFLALLIWNGLSTWWIMHATLAGAAMAIFVNSFLMSLVWWLAHAARRHFRANLGYISWMVFWLSYEYLHYQWDMEWPWLNLGNGFANNVSFIQWYEFTGTLGGTLWVLLANVALLSIVRAFQVHEKNLQQVFISLGLGFLILVVPILFSLVLYSNYHEKQNPLNFVVVQPNINPYSESYTQLAENSKKEKFLKIAQQAMHDSVDFVVGPETIFERYQEWNEAHFQMNPYLRQFADWLKNYPETELLFGASTQIIYTNSEEITKTARTRNGVTFDIFNTAIFLNSNNQSQVYHKSVLVSGVEKVPYMKYLGFLKNVFIDLGGTSGNLGSQDESSVFISEKGIKLAPVICYESVFGEYLTSYIKKGARVICIITNDGWWKNTPGYRQHMSFARLRAVETRRSIARAANTGISCFINQRGDVTEQTNWWVDAAISGKLNANNSITFYVKHGNFIGRVAAFLSTLLTMLLVVKRFVNNKKNPH